MPSSYPGAITSSSQENYQNDPVTLSNQLMVPISNNHHNHTQERSPSENTMVHTEYTSYTSNMEYSDKTTPQHTSTWTKILPVSDKEHNIRIYSGWLTFLLVISTLSLISVVQSQCYGYDKMCASIPFKGYDFPITILSLGIVYHFLSTLPFTCSRKTYRKWLVFADMICGVAYVFGLAVAAWAIYYVQPSICLSGYEWVCSSGIASIVLTILNLLITIVSLLYRWKYLFICAGASFLG